MLIINDDINVNKDIFNAFLKVLYNGSLSIIKLTSPIIKNPDAITDRIDITANVLQI